MQQQTFITLVELLRHRALETPEARAYTFLVDGSVESESLTYGELDEAARIRAAELQRMARPGERAILLYPPGLEFISALFGCFYAGVVAVPAYPPRPHRASARLRAIVEEAHPSLVLTTSALLPRAGSLTGEIPGLAGVRWLGTDALAAGRAEEWAPPALAADSLAFLQYTSGSTSDPKGVMVSHGNFLHNERLIQQACGHSAATVFVGWLPLFHDMGLMGNVLQPLYLGGRCVLMSPAAFLQSPVRWLDAVSRYGATTSGGPNFAYDLCARRIGAEQRAGLDLSTWSVAFNGAEPVRAETLERFAETFADCGFRREAFFPCYGLAEATLFVSGADRRRPFVTVTVEAQALTHHRVLSAPSGEPGSRALVSCGRPGADQRVRIVAPTSLHSCPPGEVGEIWVAGPSVAQGYWNRPEQTTAVFHAEPRDGSGEGPFLRTGDLGFLEEGELFVTGRLKDLVILRGQNHYPQDIEQTAEGSHPALLPGGVAAFALEGGGAEQLVVVVERRPRSREGVETVAPAVRRAVAEEHEIQVSTVVLVKAGAIPKTTSGKVRRGACRELFLNGGLEALGMSGLEEAAADGTPEAPTRQGLLALGPEDRRAALTAYLTAEAARVLRVAPQTMDPRQPLTRLGLDSLAAAELESGVEQGLGIAPGFDRLLGGASLEELSSRLLDRLTAETAAPTPEAKARDEAEYPLSAMQKALWFEHQLAPRSPAYNIPFAGRLLGAVEVPALRSSLTALFERHPALRTTLALREGEPVQRIAMKWDLPFTERYATDDEKLLAEVADEAHRPFDLERGPLFRATLFRCSSAKPVLLFVAHHLILDGWSLWVLLDDLERLYTAALAGRPATLEPLPAGYGDFVRWQAELLASRAGDELWEFWRTQLPVEPPAVDLPFDRRRARPSEDGGARPFRLSEELVGSLRELAREEDTTLYTVFLGAFLVQLTRYSGRPEVSVGSPVAGRGRAGFKRVVGCFFNVLVLSCELSPELSFRQLLGRLRGKVAAAIEHQDYPSHVLAERLGSGRRAGGAPLYAAQLIFQQLHPLAATASLPPAGEGGMRLDLGNLLFEVLPIEPRAVRSPLELELIEAGGGILGQLRYSADFFAATAARLVGHFVSLLREIAAHADRPLADLELLTAEERELLLGNLSRVEGVYTATIPAHKLFAEQVARAPHAVAAVHQGRALTFAELDSQADHLKTFLIEVDS